MTDIEVVKFEPHGLVACEELLLADWLLRNYCDFINNDSIYAEPPEKKSPDELSNISNQTPSMNLAKELALVRSCLVDVIYSLHCLGLWCAKRTIRIHLTEFARLLSRDDFKPGHLLESTLSVLNCVYSRLEDLSHHFGSENDDDTILRGTTSQLRLLLKYIKGAEPPPNTSWPICIVHVSRRVIAKVIALWLYEVSNERSEYGFIKPNYIVGSSRKYRDRMAVDNFDLHREASIKDFRLGKCNTLIISTVNDRCADMLKCNLVISFDPPGQFEEFLHAKMNCRYESSKYVVMLNELLEVDLERRVLKYINMEKIYSTSNRRDILDQREMDLLKELEKDYPPYPSNRDSKNPATIHRSIGIINKYCTKLPSDSFTKLSPAWNIKEVEDTNGESYYCEVRLPINSPVRQAIIGPEAPTPAIAMRLAAFTACKLLHKSGELDNNMCPIKKESMKALTPWLNTKEFARPKSKSSNNKIQSVGSTKHRQYYKKRIAQVFSGPLVSAGATCYLYKCKMVLTCEIPDEQNRRGRRIIDPNETNRNYAIVCTTRLPMICAFPVFTRSGEVMIEVELIQEKFNLTQEQVNDLRTFHEYTFSKVLRLEKYPTVFDPENSPFTVLLAPVIDDCVSSETRVDWEFVSKIVNSNDESFEPNIEQRRQFTFKKENYEDAVVIPWYRLTDRQQFAYYVAEICENMSPQSPFPDTDSGFETFIDYYESKYNIKICNQEQPVLDVDHTSARLNLLTPRYVNRKGRTLPSSTPKTRKESRESLVQKQLLIPELCTIHPFPASFWRKAVCLPAIFYRLNSLFLAEELRREVAQEIKVGFVEPPKDFVWPKLHFGWSLKDVISNHSADDDAEDDSELRSTTQHATGANEFLKKSDSEGSEKQNSSSSDRSEPTPMESNTTCPRSDCNGEDLVIDSNKYNGTDSPIEITVVDNDSDMDLIDAVSRAHWGEMTDYSIDKERILRGWYSLMNELDLRVKQSLAIQPDLLQDDDIELVAVDDGLCDANAEMQPSFGELLPNRDNDGKWLDEAWKNIKFDPTRDEIESAGPGPSVILQALTMSNASDGINLERLETVGDSFLKYSITAFLYCTHLSMHEGKLSYLRSTEISNANLYRLGKLKNLGEMMSATKFEPNDNWLAPGYLVVDGDQVNGRKDKKEIDKALAEVPYDLLRQHSIPDKSIADCVEALIGAYLTASGSRAALLFMRWLGLGVVPPEFDIEQDRQTTEETDGCGIWRWLKVPPSPLICMPPQVDERAPKTVVTPDQDALNLIAMQKLNSLYRDNQMDKFEHEIEYTFRDKAYLVQAFTHNSFYENHVTDCHQRLEFLGDALLDYLITRYLFEDPRCHSPGTLTDLRSALVNNTFFASLAVKYNFHKYLKFISDELTHVIEGFVKKFKFESKDIITKGYTLLINEGESEYAEDIEIPKALGDVFESVAGAIYLDSGMSLDQVWQVYFRMMKPEIEYFSSHVPKSPIRELLESMPQNVRFSPSELTPDRRHRVTAEVFGLGKFTGLGRNKHSAKSTAARRALRQLTKRKQTANQNNIEQRADKLDPDRTNQD